MKITIFALFFALIHQKSGPISIVFLLNFQGYGPFFEQFSEIKKSNFFRKKYPTTATTNFVKAGSKKIHSFMMIFTVYRSRMADTIVFLPKKFKDIPWHGIFFLCDIHFFLLEKISVSKIDLKKITFNQGHHFLIWLPGPIMA